MAAHAAECRHQYETQYDEYAHYDVCSLCGDVSWEEHIPDKIWIPVDEECHAFVCFVCGEVMVDVQEQHEMGGSSRQAETSTCIWCGYESADMQWRTHDATRALVEKDENGYIVPGLGDAGDRIFGTK